MKTKKLEINQLRDLRDKLYILMNDSILSESEKHIIQTAALTVCNVIDLKKGKINN